MSSLQRRPGAVAVNAAPTPNSTASVILADYRRTKPRKKPKRVRFDLVRNTLHTYSPVPCKFLGVTWAKDKSWVVYHHEEDPAGYDTLHCRQTKYIRDRPDVEDLDDDGDIGMNET